MTLTVGAGALLMALVAGIAWLSFDRVVTMQHRIIDNTLPTMEVVGAVNQIAPSTLALLDRLTLSANAQEAGNLERQGMAQLDQIGELLGQLERQSFEADLVRDLRATLDALRANLREQVGAVRDALQLQADMESARAAQRQAIDQLTVLAEALQANASAYTSATVSSLYPMIDRGAGAAQVLASLDWLVEVDIDRMERMAELQLVCFRLKSLIERVEPAGTEALLNTLAQDFSADLAILTRRIEDFRDPTRKALALRHRQVLQAALGSEGLFARQVRRVKLSQRQDALREVGSELAIRLNSQGNRILQASRSGVEQVGVGSREAIGRGAIGFLAVGGILVLTLAGIFWLLYRYELLGRLKAMEAAMRALVEGQHEIAIRPSRWRHDPLAPLATALEQFRTHAIERKRLEHSLREHQQQLETQVAQRTAQLSHANTLLEREVQLHAQARREAEEANRAKNEFLGSLSHELRTPLSGVRGSVRLLGDTSLDGRQREYLRMIDYANSTLLETLEDMLGFSRLEAGKFEIHEESFCLADVIDDMLALQSVTAEAKGLALVRDIAPGVPPWVTGDRRKLNQILLNTIGNAIKFTDEGEVSVGIEVASIPHAGQVRLAFHVSDTGIGIPADQQVAVFKPFHQVPGAAHRRVGGTGLGLAICEGLVRGMGGQISLRSTEGKGTTISFELPFAVASAPAAAPAAASDQPESWPRGLTVLVVEDDEINRVVCERYLESLGHRAHVADSGAQALEWLRQFGPPDGVLMDISLPGASGFEVTETIRQWHGEPWRNLPIIGMSAHVTPGTLAHPAAASFSAFLTKPFQRLDLARALSQCIRPTAASSPRPQVAGTDAASCLDEAYLRRELQDLGRDTVVHLAHLFGGTAASALEALDQAVDAGDRAQVGRLAHSFRSSAGNLGLTRLVETCRRLEQAAQSGEGGPVELEDWARRVSADVERSVAALRQWLQAVQAEIDPCANI